MRKPLTDVFIRTLDPPRRDALRSRIFAPPVFAFASLQRALGHGRSDFGTRVPERQRAQPSGRIRPSPYSRRGNGPGVLRRDVANGQNPVERKRHERATAPTKTLKPSPSATSTSTRGDTSGRQMLMIETCACMSCRSGRSAGLTRSGAPTSSS